MRLLITGGAGFIGSNLASLALERGHSVTIIDDLSTGFADNLKGLLVRLVEALSILTPLWWKILRISHGALVVTSTT